MPVYVGTSGWDYPHWKRIFYPPGTADKLAFFAQRFSTVELNGTSYRLPGRRVFQDWRKRTPPQFVFAVKASRSLTHMRRLTRPTQPVRRLRARARALGGRFSFNYRLISIQISSD